MYMTALHILYNIFLKGWCGSGGAWARDGVGVEARTRAEARAWVRWHVHR